MSPAVVVAACLALAWSAGVHAAPAALPVGGATPAGQPPAPAIAEIIVHGNHSTPDADVLAIAGLAVGGPAGDDALAAAQQRLDASGRFASADVRRLLRSIDVPDDYLVRVFVEERAGVSADNLTPGWVSRVTSRQLWIPVLRYDEGYGITYGVQAALDGAFGGTSQLSLPATWGGERRLGAQASRSFAGRVVTRVAVTADVARTVHPAFDLVEERRRLSGRLERAAGTGVRFGLEGAHERVRFGGARDTVGRVSGDVLVDTRTDPAFPRNAVWGRLAVDRLDVVTGVRRRVRVDASGALGLPFGSALTVRGFLTTSDGALPRYEQTMIGGGLATRGYRRGYRVGDNAAGASVALARPFGSPLQVVRHGLRVFVDWGAAYAAGTKVGDAAFDRGAGVGWFANLMAVNLYVDAGRANGRWRAHVRFGTGF